MGTDSKTAVQQPSSKVSVVSSSSSSKNIKKKKSKSTHHKSKHNKQTRSESSSSRSSNDYDRNATSSSKKSTKSKNSKDKSKLSSSNDARSSEKKSTSNKKKPHRSKHDSSESPPKRNNSTRSRSKSRSRSRSDRSSDRSSSRDSQPRHRYKNVPRRSNSNMQNVYAPMNHPNFPGNMPRHYAPQGRGGRMPPYMAPGMMGGPPMRNNNGNRRSGGNSPPQSLLGGYRPPPGNFRGRGGGPMNNPANIYNMLNLIHQQQQQQQKQKPGAHKYANPNNPNNRFYQQFQDNYKKISQGQKVSNLYQASFPVQHIPREMRFNFRLLGRNIFTASDEEEEEQQKQAAAAAAAAAAGSDKRQKQRRESSSSSDSRSDDDRRKRRDDDDDDDDDDRPSTSKSKSSPPNKTDPKRSTNKTNRNRTSSSTTGPHPKAAAPPHELLTDPANLSSFLAGIMRGENPEVIANTLATAAAVATSKQERTKKQQEKKVQKFKNYARFQQIQATAGGVVPQTNPEEVEKKIHGLARRLQMKTIGLHDDYESQGIKRSDESSNDSDGNPRRQRSSGSSTDRSKDKDAGSDASGSSQRRKLKKLNKRSNKKLNAAGQLVGSSDSEQHRSDGNDSDGSMLQLSEDLKTISYYIKDRERMLHEMFRCVRGPKLQAILPDALKTRSLDEIKAKCLDQLDILSKKRIRAILLAQPMTSSSGTEDSTDEDEQDFFTLYPHLKSSLDPPNNNESSTTVSGTTATTTPAETNKKSLPNSKFRPVQMQAVTENASAFQSTLAAPVVVGGDEDVRDYYEGFKQIKKLASLRRNEQDDELLPFPDQSGKVLQPFGSNLPKFEFKPITSLTHSQQAHLNARRAAQRQQQQQIDVRQEIDDLLGIDDFILPDGERPISSAQLSSSEQRRYGLPPRLHHKVPAGPPKKGSLGDLLKQKNRQSGERSPSPATEELSSKQSRQRGRSRSLSSTGSRQWSRSSSRSTNDERISRHSSREMTLDDTKKKSDNVDELNDMDDLSKLLDLNEEDELLLLQIEVEQEERNIRREEKRRRKEEKKIKKSNKKHKSIPSNPHEQTTIVQQCLDDLLSKIISSPDDTRILSKRTFEQSDDELSKKIKLERPI